MDNAILCSQDSGRLSSLRALFLSRWASPPAQHVVDVLPAVLRRRFQVVQPLAQAIDLHVDVLHAPFQLVVHRRRRQRDKPTMRHRVVSSARYLQLRIPRQTHPGFVRSEGGTNILPTPS